MSITLKNMQLNAKIHEAYSRLMEKSNADLGRELEWKFASTPAGPGTFGAAIDGEKYLGLSAYIRHYIKLAAHKGIALQAVDSIVAPSARGQGIFTRIATHVAEEIASSEIDLLWGFPNANAAFVWFSKLGWANHGEVPILFKPLRSGILTRRIGIHGMNLPLSRLSDGGATAANSAPKTIDALWDRFSYSISAAIIRDREYVEWRLFNSPCRIYRVVYEIAGDEEDLVATTSLYKHGGHIGYVMEAMGGKNLNEVLRAEIGRLAACGVEIVLAWCFPWSPNYRAYRRLGFLPLPPRFRPIKINFGSRAVSKAGLSAHDPRSWYLSYLDSDTV